jgi:hypothetical protein
MYLIPILGTGLALVLFAGATKVARDMENLQTWMKNCAAEEPVTESAEA